jgi:uncharacterized cofD-like protein
MKQIKAIIFDLDDTLYDTGPITEAAISQCVESMMQFGLKCSLEEGRAALKRIIKDKPLQNRFSALASEFGAATEEIVTAGKERYYNAKFKKLTLYPGTKETLRELKKRCTLILITYGSVVQQNKKIDALGIRQYFSYIFVDEHKNKDKPLNEVMKVLSLEPEDILSVGDRIDDEIKLSNKLGMITVRIAKGKYKDITPTTDLERADYTVKDITEVPTIVKKINHEDCSIKPDPKIVAIGGGTGLPAVLEGLRNYTHNLTAIVTVTDTGRSSGILRRELHVLPPGDIRNCLIALSNSEKLMCDLFQYRFSDGCLNGHSFGNIFIAALTKVTGSFEKSLEQVSKILKLKGKVLPSTFDNVHICARLKDGRELEQEGNIVDRHNPDVHLRSPIDRVFLKPKAKACPEALKAIEEADLIVICPGSLYTSVITNLLVDGIPGQIRKSKAMKVYISNIMTHPGQTYGFKASDHLREVVKYLGETPDYVIVNTKKPNKKLLEAYRKENADIVKFDKEGFKKFNIEVIEADLIEDTKEKKILWEKKDLLRHDSKKIATILVNLLEQK